MKIKNAFILALILRLLFAPLFYHPDMKSQYFHFQFLSQGKTNIYQYISDNKVNLPYKDTFNYLPLTYLTFGIVNIGLSSIMPNDYYNWINDWGPNQNNYTNLPIFLLILKLPYILFDLLIGYLLYKLSKSKNLALFWLFNPVSFYLIYILGNFDVLPAVLTLLSLYLLHKNSNLALMIFGIAIAIKIYPIILLPIFLFKLTKNIPKTILNIVITMLPITISLILYINNPAFWQSFMGSGLTQKIFELKFINIPVFPVIYTLIVVSAYFSKTTNLPKYISYIFLLFISTVNFHPQWILWFLPFHLLQNNIFSKKQIIINILLVLSISIYIILFNDNFLTWGHLIPIDGEFISLSSPYEIIRYKFLYNPQLFQQYAKYIISILSILIITINEKNPNN